MFGLSGCHGLRTKMRWQELLYLRYPIQDESVSDIVTLDAQYWGWQAHLQILLDSLDLLHLVCSCAAWPWQPCLGMSPQSMQRSRCRKIAVRLFYSCFYTCHVTSNRLSLTHFSTSYFHTLICIMEKQDISQR